MKIGRPGMRRRIDIGENDPHPHRPPYRETSTDRGREPEHIEGSDES